MRLPRTIVFPFGYTIRFRYATAAEMKAHDAEELDGFWDADSRTIYVRKRLPAKRLRYMIGHEIDHAVNDWRHRMQDDGIARN